ncbi:leucyl/phenylalanyl-tRNA--protein transferase [Petrocella sp. FN5]|uniref:leucyl/phenylalanyl-tRNA--protein transferase n=1 Tax=Petrocella sp. FN5 TaxID=3032002 RepID=UPI0023DA4917|nr:leucyl/phenylalanyl-tRNA--protein transferase [Petrocella sp. FN5]MDF1616782.1 leucyl/phenylalanyl-tRNA--protein transferase [Petrocella sp. FN5]
MNTVKNNRIVAGVKYVLPDPICKKLGKIREKSNKVMCKHFPELYKYKGRVAKLNKDIEFPSIQKGNKKIRFGPIAYLLAYGGDLSVERIVEATKQGILPFSTNGEPYLWWVADQRCVIFLDSIHIERPIKSLLKKDMFTITVDKAFLDVIYGCRGSHEGFLWLTDDRIQSLCDLHQAGYSHSIELWLDDELVGGILGFHIGGYFHIESKFGAINNGSKYLFIVLCLRMKELGFKFCDCGLWPTDHLKRLGASVIKYDEFIALLDEAILQESPVRDWEKVFYDCNVHEISK